MKDARYYFDHMLGILGDEFEAFKAAFDGKPRHKALRVNTLKISVGDFLRLVEEKEKAGVRTYGLRPNPLCGDSFYTVVKPSLDPLYHAGLYYMQEPSASAVVEALSPFIGRAVLDLCAAPGGKSTQLAAKMQGKGTLVCNEPDGERKWALIENLDRLGVRNAVVTSALPERFLRGGTAGVFDTVVVDAPCSGGGMMRYENVDYTEDTVRGCAARQKEILDVAEKLLSGGGYMLYSTCTFAPEEDEDNVRYLMSKGLTPVDIPQREGETAGIGIKEARRVYPHNFDGEGHFYCVLRKTSDGDELETEKSKRSTVCVCGADIACDVNRIARLPFDLPVIPCVPVFRFGAHVYERIQKRVRDKKTGKYYDARELSYALSHALYSDELKKADTVELGEIDAVRYLRGEQLDIELPRGDRIATADGYALGFVRSAPDGTGKTALKNMYPKKLRIL